MDNIDLFDDYINDNLSADEIAEFKARLKSDKEFKTEFLIYCQVVMGIYREAEQDNKDFEMAMKGISEQKLKEIIDRSKWRMGGSPEVGARRAALAASPAVMYGKASVMSESVMAPPKLSKAMQRVEKRTSFWSRTYKLWIGIGAAVVIGFFVILPVFNSYGPPSEPRGELAMNKEVGNQVAINQEAMNKVDNAIYYAYVSNDKFGRGSSRGGGEEIDITKLSDQQLADMEPDLEKSFRSETDDVDIAEAESELVLVYIRLHQREKAKALLAELISKFKGNADFEADITNWTTIQGLLE